MPRFQKVPARSQGTPRSQDAKPTASTVLKREVIGRWSGSFKSAFRKRAAGARVRPTVPSRQGAPRRRNGSHACART